MKTILTDKEICLVSGGINCKIGVGVTSSCSAILGTNHSSCDLMLPGVNKTTCLTLGMGFGCGIINECGGSSITKFTINYGSSISPFYLIPAGIGALILGGVISAAGIIGYQKKCGYQKLPVQ